MHYARASCHLISIAPVCFGELYAKHAGSRGDMASMSENHLSYRKVCMSPSSSIRSVKLCMAYGSDACRIDDGVYFAPGARSEVALRVSSYGGMW